MCGRPRPAATLGWVSQLLPTGLGICSGILQNSTPEAPVRALSWCPRVLFVTSASASPPPQPMDSLLPVRRTQVIVSMPDIWKRPHFFPFAARIMMYKFPQALSKSVNSSSSSCANGSLCVLGDDVKQHPRNATAALTSESVPARNPMRGRNYPAREHKKHLQSLPEHLKPAWSGSSIPPGAPAPAAVGLLGLWGWIKGEIIEPQNDLGWEGP